MNKKNFINNFSKNGYVIVKNVLTKSSIQKLVPSIEKALKKEVQYHGTKNYSYYGYVLSNPFYGGEFLKILDNKKLVEKFNFILGDPCIIYSYTSSSMPPHSGNDSSKIHVDSPLLIKNFPLRMGVIIPLVDFTIENGCTSYLPKSHNFIKKPDKNYYNKRKKNLIISAGDAWFFDCRLWHAGGINNTNLWRHAITINMCRAWMKQRIDMPELLKNRINIKKLSFTQKQKLGFYSIPPKSYNEYYDKKIKRIFV